MQQAKKQQLIYVRPESYINDVTNMNLIANKANIEGTCNKDDINRHRFEGSLFSLFTRERSLVWESRTDF